MKKSFKFIDLFAGIGGFRLALEQLGGQCLFSSEIDQKACDTYEMNFAERPFGDIRQVTGAEKTDTEIDIAIPEHHILAAGFPCQPFSLAGVSSRNFLGQAHGLLDETKGTLFFDICRIISVKKPDIVFLENVKNIVNHDNGNTFSIITDTLTNLGYSVHYKVVNAQTRIPQKRIRCFIVAFRKQVDHFSFPEFSGEPIPLSSILEPHVSDSYTLSDKAWQGHQRRTKRNLERGTDFTAHTAKLGQPSNTLVARYYKDGKECLIPQTGKNPRMLTPRECARLQGFPDSFKLNPSKSAAYKQFGNSVPVPVVKEIAACFLNKLKLSDSPSIVRTSSFVKKTLVKGNSQQLHLRVK